MVNIRKRVFFLKDRLKGNRINTNLQEIESIHSASTPGEVQSYHDERIGMLLENAKRSISFYHDKKGGLDDMPVVNKNLIKQHLNAFIDQGIDKSRLIKMTTSGSTGTPFVTYQDHTKKSRNTADTLFYGKCAGYNFGEPLYYFKIWSVNNKKSQRLLLAQNIVPVDVIKLSDHRLKEVLEEIALRGKRVHLIGYSSAFDRLAKYMQRVDYNSAESRVGSVITMSEALSLETKRSLEHYFGVKPCSRYSNIENGIIAQQTLKENDAFEINRASYKVEILRFDEDVAVKDGELGRIVVTDLYNFVMPFIRYDTGDVGRFLKTEGNGIDERFLGEIQGRKLDLLLDASGEVISSYLVYKNMFQYPEIDQYQLIQEGEKEYRINLSIKGTFHKERQMLEEFQEYLGSEAKIDVQYVNEIPLLASGKRRKIVNNYLKNQSI